MGQKFESLEQRHIDFIQNQKIFFVGTAAQDGRVNISPKGLDTLKVVDQNHIAWLNLTGSGNETACHLLSSPRMTIMFCSFENNPVILRTYGTAKTIDSYHSEWEKSLLYFPTISGCRQIFILTIDLVQTSCGFGVPLFEFKENRTELTKWSDNLGESGIKKYWEKKNTINIDGKQTHIKFT